ncbi:hypothetical protein C8J57DRAFT_1495403 [Mycena rebaudengoi]|nr:hypothetical protein C8J57DRAFT_1495403 [Mycena rebaudengoi]
MPALVTPALAPSIHVASPDGVESASATTERPAPTPAACADTRCYLTAIQGPYWILPPDASAVESPSPTHAEPSSTPPPPQAIRARPAPSCLVVPPAARPVPPPLPAPASTAPTCHGQRHYPYPTPSRPQQLPPTPNRARAAQSPVVSTSVTRKLVGRARAWLETPVDAEVEIAAELVRHGAPGRANPDEYSVVAG